MRSFLLGGGRAGLPYQHFRGPKDISKYFGPTPPVTLIAEIFKFEVCSGKPNPTENFCIDGLRMAIEVEIRSEVHNSSRFD